MRLHDRECAAANGDRRERNGVLKEIVVPLARASNSADCATLKCLLICVLLTGCAAPWRQLEAQAKSSGFEKSVFMGEGFRHIGFYKAGGTGRDVLHVYLDGDGTPYLAGLPAPDPTPPRSTLLDLAATDPNSVLYLGRPCYLGTVSDPGCERRLWTEARYSPAVIDSMTAALRRALQSLGRPQLVFIGYSGGGAIAQLMAARLAGTIAVVTVAANLDIDLWRKLKSLPPLSESLNPADYKTPSAIWQQHYVGTDDDMVPPQVTRAGMSESAILVQIEGFDHQCCWSRIWPDLLSRIRSIESSSATGL